MTAVAAEKVCHICPISEGFPVHNVREQADRLPLEFGRVVMNDRGFWERATEQSHQTGFDAD